jgi:serine/threonine protein kinase/tetratricopeptide (TPR) repeat protein
MLSMDRDLWRALSPLLDRALDLDAEARDALLADLQNQHPHLAEPLAQLLREHERLVGSGFLESSLAIDDVPLPSLAGYTIGPYTLDAPLGIGGMGTVWRAHRSDGRFEGSVAVKLLNLALLDGRGDEHFKREGTTLARLTHPNIARLLDAGVTPTGQPYLVLEYVEGVRIDRFADDRQLDPIRRLELFLQVAEAVAYAHASLVVHRDLKPSNILVTGDGRVKLLDFGVARLLEQDARPERTVTLGLSNAFTPEYAAPEQVRGDQVTTATDVYSLGILLYTLLTGRRPIGEDRRTLAEHLRALLEDEPVRASAAVVTAPRDEAAKRATLRQSSPERLQRLYRGDLDNMLGRALEKTADRRYASVTAFADDVRRFLNDEPLSVHGEAWTYRAAKFVRRHRVGVAATAAIITLLTVGIAVSTNLMLEARRQRDEARFQARRAQASSEFMRYLVTQIGSKPMTMKEVLDRGRVALEQQYGGDPAFIARMLIQLSGPYIELGDFATAEGMMARALEIATRIDEPELRAVTHCGAAFDAVQRPDIPAARSHLEAARRQLQRVTAPSPGLLVECAVGETELATAENRVDDAVRHAREAVQLLESEGITGTTRYTSALSNLASAHIGAGQHRESVAVLQKLIDATNRIGRGRTIGMAVALNNRGVSERVLGWYLAAERSSREATELARGLDAAGRLPAGLTLNYGRALGVLGRHSDAVHWLNLTLEQPDAAPRFRTLAKLGLAAVALDRGDHASANELFATAAPELGTSPSPGDRVTLAVLRARLDAAAGRIEDARQRVRDELAKDGFPDRLSPNVHLLLESGARLALAAGDPAEAIRLATDAVRACDMHFGTEQASALTGRARLTLGLALRASGRTADARAEIERAATLIEHAGGADHPWAREARETLAAFPR